jgi:hypothetical protein
MAWQVLHAATVYIRHLRSLMLAARSMYASAMCGKWTVNPNIGKVYRQLTGLSEFVPYIRPCVQEIRAGQASGGPRLSPRRPQVIVGTACGVKAVKSELSSDHTGDMDDQGLVLASGRPTLILAR